MKEKPDIKVLRCIHCQAPIMPKEADRALECGSCHTRMVIENGELVPLTVTVVGFSRQESLPRIFIPFWVIDADITVRNEQVRGGRVSRLIHGRTRMDGAQRFFICASDLPADTESWWNRTLTSAHIPLTLGEGTLGEEARLPVSLPMADARGMAEFLFLGHELDESGTLQSIDYDFSHKGLNLVYLPFYRKDDTYLSGLAALQDAIPPAIPAEKEHCSRLAAVSGALSPEVPGGSSWFRKCRVPLLALAGIVILVIALMMVFPGFQPLQTILLFAGQNGNDTAATPLPTTAATFTVSPTDTVPRGTEVAIQVQKNPPQNLVTVIFAGGPGQRVIKSCEVILTTSEGEIKKRDLSPIINSKVTLQGTDGDDHIEVYVTQKSGMRYKVLDAVLEPYQVGSRLPDEAP